MACFDATASPKVLSAHLEPPHHTQQQIGGLVDSADGVVLFSREGGPQGSAGARILKEDAGTPGLLGLALVGDIRTLTFVSQGAELQPQHGAYRVEEVSEDGRRITKVAPVSSDGGGGAAVTPKEVCVCVGARGMITR